MKILLLITSSMCTLFCLVCLFQLIVGRFVDKKWVGEYTLGFLIGLQLAAIGFYLV